MLYPYFGPDLAYPDHEYIILFNQENGKHYFVYMSTFLRKRFCNYREIVAHFRSIREETIQNAHVFFRNQRKTLFFFDIAGCCFARASALLQSAAFRIRSFLFLAHAHGR